MFKPLTLSVSLAMALGACSVSLAGLFHKDDCATCGLASPQGVVAPSAQSVIASPQSYDAGCGDVCDPCAGGKKHNMLGFLKKLHKPKMYTYEWVLKKKRVKHHGGSDCGTPSCDTCGTTAVYPSAQYASPQGGATYPSYQAAPAAAPQSAATIPGDLRPAVQSGDVPPPPEATPSASLGSPLFLSPAGN